MNYLFKNANLVLVDRVVQSNLHVVDGRIEEVGPLRTDGCSCVDCSGDYLIPGLVDVHTDNVEQHARPRAGVTWPDMHAVVRAYDWQLVGGGITTVMDSLAIGEYDRGGDRTAMLDLIVNGLDECRTRGLLIADHHLHLRCELSDPSVVDMLERYLENDRLRLASLMDHTPGQRQYRDLERYRRYRQKKDGRVWSDEEFTRFVDEGRRNLELNGVRNRALVERICHAKGIPLASHDDATAPDVDESFASRVTISEFPTTVVAARRARELGMKIVMGAPNIVLGGSHSGNVSALELAKQGLVDILCSDYVPGSLLGAIFKLAEWGFALTDAVAMASAAPAAVLGLTDRGRIAPGLRADLLQVRLVGGAPVLRGVWVGGRRVV
ncbi:alpha-D-ribose 1-methylphosphonate 5-triphosphate diphosphatase [Burkholderia contaminans]|uniref:Alpha-D-ribose 1-methylphosphonate 5-triphosphate diphosphatase n=1 Tax=Burkholderia contaminans TaxID=488447 RepID=A0A3N8PUH5_9BURK|nr:alpha-D-ribose 1-methylphosphonate 5-triphosphate diphosphatase [Burkholderia contaminans]RQT14965.1 alpha-D-ribose 1-methylphosphonate 5-triphosphate diphosphatase [Burkholderia contaminans]